DAHHAAHGQWPVISSGPVAGVAQLSWSTVDRILRYGGRGLRGRTSLARLLNERRGLSRPCQPPKRHALSVDQVLTWADVHHSARGEGPDAASGPVAGAPGEFWNQIDGYLRYGYRGLPGGSSVRRLLQEHRGAPSRTLSPELILTWSQAHHAATGRWPHAG